MNKIKYIIEKKNLNDYCEQSLNREEPIDVREKYLNQIIEIIDEIEKDFSLQHEIVNCNFFEQILLSSVAKIKEETDLEERQQKYLRLCAKTSFMLYQLPLEENLIKRDKDIADELLTRVLDLPTSTLTLDLYNHFINKLSFIDNNPKNHEEYFKQYIHFHKLKNGENQSSVFIAYECYMFFKKHITMLKFYPEKIKQILKGTLLESTNLKQYDFELKNQFLKLEDYSEFELKIFEYLELENVDKKTILNINLDGISANFNSLFALSDNLKQTVIDEMKEIKNDIQITEVDKEDYICALTKIIKSHLKALFDINPNYKIEINIENEMINFKCDEQIKEYLLDILKQVFLNEEVSQEKINNYLRELRILDNLNNLDNKNFKGSKKI